MPSRLLTSDSYFLAHNFVTVFYPGFARAGTEVTTGQPSLEFQPTFQKLNDRLVLLGQEPLLVDPARGA